MGWLSFLGPKPISKGARALAFTNTLSNAKEPFAPLKGREVLMYNCGPTVYDFVHIGNLRAYVFADLLRRALHFNGYDVSQVINITDVGHLVSDADEGEDKIELGARRERISPAELVQKYTDAFFADLARLNVETKNVFFPRASRYIREQIALAQTLEEKGYAYRTADGLYFDTSKFKDYGKLGGIDVGHLKEGARVEVREKRHPTDFALWKLTPAGTTRAQEWDSPWGKGFPGWHLECTAMIFSELGKQIDIHTGGIDHIPIHHNNEIAQAEAVTGKPYARFWLHVAFITIDGQKISKSLGNTIRLDQLMDRGFSPLSYRYWLLTAHYRSPVNFTWEALEGAHKAYLRLLKIFVEELGQKTGAVSADYLARFTAYINDDLNTPQALALLWELVKDEKLSPADKRATLLMFDRVLGLGLIEGDERIKSMLEGTAKRLSVTEAPEEIQKLIAEREAARQAKDWEKADTLRASIEEAGFTVTDSKEGPELREKK